MRSTILMSLAIVLVGSAAGVVANQTVYKLSWVRESKAPPPPIAGPMGGPAERASTDDLTTADSTLAPVATGESTSAEASGVARGGDPCVARPEDKPGTVRMECVLQFLESGGAFFVDAREAREIAGGQIRGAIHLPSSAIYANIENVMASGAQVDDVIIVYCGGGDCEASHNVADALRDDFHYQRVYIYEKGWEEIESSGRFGAYIESGESN